MADQQRKKGHGQQNKATRAEISQLPVQTALGRIPHSQQKTPVTLQSGQQINSPEQNSSAERDNSNQLSQEEDLNQICDQVPTRKESHFSEAEAEILNPIQMGQHDSAAVTSRSFSPSKESMTFSTSKAGFEPSSANTNSKCGQSRNNTVEGDEALSDATPCTETLSATGSLMQKEQENFVASCDTAVSELESSQPEAIYENIANALKSEESPAISKTLVRAEPSASIQNDKTIDIQNALNAETEVRTDTTDLEAKHKAELSEVIQQEREAEAVQLTDISDHDFVVISQSKESAEPEQAFRITETNSGSQAIIAEHEESLSEQGSRDCEMRNQSLCPEVSETTPNTDTLAIPDPHAKSNKLTPSETARSEELDACKASEHKEEELDTESYQTCSTAFTSSRNPTETGSFLSVSEIAQQQAETEIEDVSAGMQHAEQVSLTQLNDLNPNADLDGAPSKIEETVEIPKCVQSPVQLTTTQSMRLIISHEDTDIKPDENNQQTSQQEDAKREQPEFSYSELVASDIVAAPIDARIQETNSSIQDTSSDANGDDSATRQDLAQLDPPVVSGEHYFIVIELSWFQTVG